MNVMESRLMAGGRVVAWLSTAAVVACGSNRGSPSGVISDGGNGSVTSDSGNGSVTNDGGNGSVTNDGGNGSDASEAGDGSHPDDGGAVSCTWVTQTSNATCPAGPCPIALDEVLKCNDTEMAAPGVRVGAAPDATWLATSSTNDRIVYRLANGTEQLQDGVPAGFLRATMSLALAADGSVHLAAADSDGAMYARYANGMWTSSILHRNAQVLDLEVGSDGTPLMWLANGGSSGYSLATQATAGVWTLADAATPVPYINAGNNRFTLASDGSVVALAFDLGVPTSTQLRALVGGVARSIGSPVTEDVLVPDYAVTSAPAPTAPTGPLFAVAIRHADGVHVVGESAQAPETEVTVAGSAAARPTCSTAAGPCTGPCHETSSGMEARAYALAWTADGVAWLVYVETHFDQTIAYTPQGDSPQICVGVVSSDSSTGTLHVVRVALDGSAPGEALSMPIDRPGTVGIFGPGDNDDPRLIDARGFGKDLAIGIRTGWKENAVRVVRVDTSKL
jgi:hypothetical protein